MPCPPYPDDPTSIVVEHTEKGSIHDYPFLDKDSVVLLDQVYTVSKESMKKLMLLLVLVCMFIGITAIPAVAAQPVKVVLDDENLTFDVPPTIISGRALVPVRKIVESMGGDVAWNAKSKTVTVNRDNTAIVLVPGFQCEANRGYP